METHDALKKSRSNYRKAQFLSLYDGTRKPEASLQNKDISYAKNSENYNL
jgi:hypothetical protein